MKYQENDSFVISLSRPEQSPLRKVSAIDKSPENVCRHAPNKASYSQRDIRFNRLSLARSGLSAPRRAGTAAVLSQPE